MSNDILLLGIIILLGVFGNLLFKITKIPESIFLIILGLLIGPTFHLIPQNFFVDNSAFLATFALVVVILDSGLNLDLFQAVKDLKLSFFLTLLNQIFTVILITGVTTFVFKWNVLHGMLLGIIFSGTTTITISYLLQRAKASRKVKRLFLLESVINDVSLIFLATLLFTFVAPSAVQKHSLFLIIFNKLFLSVIFGILAAIGWIQLFLKFLRGHKLTYVFTLGLALLLYAFAELIQLNGAIMLITMALILGNHTQLAKKFNFGKIFSSDEEKEVLFMKRTDEEITFLIRTFFFVFLGIIFDPRVFNSFILIALVFFVLIAKMAGRFIAGKILANFEPKFGKYAILNAAMISSGFTATLVTFLAMRSGVKIQGLSEIVLLLILTSAIISMVGTALFNRKK